MQVSNQKEAGKPGENVSQKEGHVMREAGMIDIIVQRRLRVRTQWEAFICEFHYH